MIQAGQRVKVRYSHPSKHYEWREGEFRYYTEKGFPAVQFGNRICPVNPDNIKEAKK